MPEIEIIFRTCMSGDKSQMTGPQTVELVSEKLCPGFPDPTPDFQHGQCVGWCTAYGHALAMLHGECFLSLLLPVGYLWRDLVDQANNNEQRHLLEVALVFAISAPSGALLMGERMSHRGICSHRIIRRGICVTSVDGGDCSARSASNSAVSSLRDTAILVM